MLGYPLLGRWGLGNNLFPWARCFVWCHQNNAPMLAPQWGQIRLGPYLRRELDKRTYHRQFHSQGYITGYKRSFYLLTQQEISEQDVAAARLAKKRNFLVTFKGMEGYFANLKQHYAEVSAELKRITKSEYLPEEKGYRNYIGIHVRLGDFATPQNAQLLRQGGENFRLPLAWYSFALQEMRRVIGSDFPALLFSDGSEEELHSLLALPQVELYRGGAAITDLLALSQTRLMIASGSSYSMWASYLGQIPCVWFPGQRKYSVLAGNAELEPELEFGKRLPSAFAQAIRPVMAV